MPLHTTSRSQASETNRAAVISELKIVRKRSQSFCVRGTRTKWLSIPPQDLELSHWKYVFTLNPGTTSILRRPADLDIAFLEWCPTGQLLRSQSLLYQTTNSLLSSEGAKCVKKPSNKQFQQRRLIKQCEVEAQQLCKKPSTAVATMMTLCSIWAI